MMLKQFLFVACFSICCGVTAAEITTEFAPVPELLQQARTIVSALVKDKLPEEILAMVNDIAVALSQENLCGVEDIVAMMEVGIPFETAYESVIQTCNIQGTELAALNRAFAPGLTATGGAGAEVSP